MRPAFTRALYYPFIDIQNSDWLKTAVLFWDSISTIVPESISHPYECPDSQYLADIGFLKPIYVNSGHRSVVAIEKDIINMLFSPQFFNMLSMPKNEKLSRIFDDKMSYPLKQELKEYLIYDSRMPYSFRRHLRQFYKDGIFHLDDGFAYTYMVTLANKICEDQSIALITDDITSENFSNSIRMGTHTSVLAVDSRMQEKRRYKQGLLLDLVVDGLCISPDISLSDIVDFKERHKDELGIFRTQLAKLIQGVSTNTTIEVLRQETKDLYVNEFLPAYNNFKSALKSSGIRWVTDNILKISLLSVGATSVPTLLGLAVPQALLAGIGVSILASAVSYKAEKKQKLRENPYSYLLATEKELS